MTSARRALITTAALLIGLALLIVAVARADIGSFQHLAAQLGLALPLALLPSGAWHATRTLAWHQCFPRDARPPFARLFRVRLAAEAFSYLTISGIAGEPLKVVLLNRDAPVSIAATAVALERLAYLLTTTTIAATAASLAILTLPLSPEWTRIFTIVAIVATILVLAPIVLLARHRVDLGAARTVVGRFLRELDSEVRVLLRTDRRRLAALLGLEIVAYGLMAMEVWVVLWVVGLRVSLMDSVAAETFTRVASMLSAFIPANVGALEAANVAAAGAVHAGAGAAALAVVRRLRGLLWCGAGFLVYPHQARRERRNGGLVLLEDEGARVASSERLAGLPIGERVLLAAARAGYARVVIWSPRQLGGWESIVRRMKGALDVVIVSDDRAWRDAVGGLEAGAEAGGLVTLVAPGIVPSAPLLIAARTQSIAGEVPAGGATWPNSGVFRCTPQEVLDRRCVRFDPLRDIDPAPTAWDVVNNRAHLSLQVATPAQLAAAEQRLRRSIYKATDPDPARFNRRLSIPISVALIRWTRCSPHAMSVFVLLLGFYAGWLFSQGSYATGVFGAIVSWAASVLDGCDGELARLQYKESRFGCWLDTLGDYTYYLAIFTGLAIGTIRTHDWVGFRWAAAALLVGVVLTMALLVLLRQRLTGDAPERFYATARAQFEGTGSPLARFAASLVKSATRAVMPIGILIFAVVGQLPALLLLAAISANIYWLTLASRLRYFFISSANSVNRPSKPPIIGDTLPL